MILQLLITVAVRGSPIFWNALRFAVKSTGFIQGPEGFEKHFYLLLIYNFKGELWYFYTWAFTFCGVEGEVLT